jgi:hypothetical protein
MPTLQSSKNGTKRVGQQLSPAAENSMEISDNKGVIN